MNQENGTPSTRQRPPSSSGLFLILIFLFMMFGGDSEPFSHNDLRDSLQTLKDEYSNYTAWMDGLSSNYTLQRESQDIIGLRQAFLHTPAIPPITTYGYYNNITAHYISKNIQFRNLTHPPPEVGWGSLAHALYDGKNLTLVQSRAEGWNWTQKMQMSISLFSYKSFFLPANATPFYRFRGFLELEAPDLRTSMLDGPLINLRMEGIHLPQNGSLMALVQPKHIMPDIRQLPGMVPPGFENATIQVIAGQMAERIKEFEIDMRAGTIENESDGNPLTRCSFTFHGQIDPLFVPQGLIDEYEKEMSDPSGLPLENLPKLRLNGVLMSEECGILLELNDVTGISASRLKQRIITFSAISSVAFYLLIQLSLQVSDQWRTATGLLRGSRGVMATWLIADSYAAISHLMAAVMTNEVRYALLIPGFLGCVLLATDLRLLTYLNGVQMMLNQATATATTAATATAPAPAPGPASTTPIVALEQPAVPDPLVQAAAPASRSNRPVSAQPVHPQSASRVAFTIVRWIFSNDFRAWFAVMGIVSTLCMIFFDLPIYGAWFILISSTWSAQVLRNVYQKTRRVLRHDTIIFSSIIRLFMPLYLFACPNNLLNIEPARWAWILPSWVVIQVATLIGQDYFGPTWFIPDFWNTGSEYDYHPDLGKPDEESMEPKLGNCSICMESISADQGDVGHERGTFLQLCWKQAAKRRRVYALSPCGHHFHTNCLEQWLEIKSVCPVCRSPLPPL